MLSRASLYNSGTKNRVPPCFFHATEGLEYGLGLSQPMDGKKRVRNERTFIGASWKETNVVHATAMECTKTSLLEETDPSQVTC